MTTRHCEHVKANGHFCGSPAMRGRNYCFFHIVEIGRRLRLERYESLGLRAPAMELPLLEDAASVQLALMQVTEALLKGTLDRKTAGLVLYSLQTASSNLHNMQIEAEADAKANTAICNRYDSLEQDYELDEETASGLRVEDAEEEEDSEPVVSREEQPVSTVSTPEPGSETVELDPRRLPPLRLSDPRVSIPKMLTEDQYYQAQVAMFQYRLDHNVDANDKTMKVVPQRAAISQKIVMGARKPVASVPGEEEKQLAASN